MKSYLGGLTDQIDSGDLAPAEGDIEQALESLFAFDSTTTGGEAVRLSTEPPTKQSTYDEISSDKDLVGKIAGNDATGQYVDWTVGMAGWGDGTMSPEALVRHWFAQLDDLAVDRANNATPQGPDGAPIGAVFVTATGQDLAQLLQKFLLGAVAFSQGADDYLDDDTEGKGLLSDNTMAEEGKPYSALEHAWDEGFGYFGAARDYADYTDDEIAAKGGRPEYASGHHDFNRDGLIDLTSEYNFGHSQNAGKRDRGSNVVTDFSGDAITAFTAGRLIIADAGGALDEDAMEALRAERNKALEAWEKAIAATVVHYVNDTLKDMGSFDTDDYSFLDHAKHWSELKGFALSLQFNRRSPILDDYKALHEKIGDAPVLPDAGETAIDDYKVALIEARTLLGDAYGFEAENLGDADGEGGW